MTLTVCFIKKAILLFRFVDDTRNVTEKTANATGNAESENGAIDLIKHPCASNPCRVLLC